MYRAGNAPSGCAPFTLHGEHIICEFDPDDPDDTAFTAAVRLGRALALSAARDHADVVDAAAVRRDLDGIRAQLNAIAGMKSKLTSISTATGDVRNGLDALRQGVLDRVMSIEGNVADALRPCGGCVMLIDDVRRSVTHLMQCFLDSALETQFVILENA